MKEFSHYSEEDFQSYLDGSYGGDGNALENHLLECEPCNKNFKAYSLIWLFAKNDLKTEPLRIDLAYSVANKIFAAKESKPVFEKFMYGLLICLGIVSLFLYFNYLIAYPVPTPFLLLIIPVGGYLWLNYKEIKIVEQKFASR
jgi:hypothetical protein